MGIELHVKIYLLNQIFIFDTGISIIFIMLDFRNKNLSKYLKNQNVMNDWDIILLFSLELLEFVVRMLFSFGADAGNGYQVGSLNNKIITPCYVISHDLCRLGTNCYKGFLVVFTLQVQSWFILTMLCYRKGSLCSRCRRGNLLWPVIAFVFAIRKFWGKKGYFHFV